MDLTNNHGRGFILISNVGYIEWLITLFWYELILLIAKIRKELSYIVASKGCFFKRYFYAINSKRILIVPSLLT